MNDNVFTLLGLDATAAEHLAAFGHIVRHVDFLAWSPSEGCEFANSPLLMAISEDFENGGVAYALTQGPESHA